MWARGQDGKANVRPKLIEKAKEGVKLVVVGVWYKTLLTLPNPQPQFAEDLAICPIWSPDTYEEAILVESHQLISRN
jgi:hypothetical protein